MKITFVSNYINHHQIPFCQEMGRLTGGQFFFVQTEPMEQERVEMGWQPANLPFVHRFYENPEFCRELIMDSDVVIFGGCEDESYIQPRLAAGKPVIRNSERLYRDGQWKAVSPRGLIRKYKDHTRYRKAPVYLLCSGAYVPSDFHIVRAYPGKMYCWGYFTETKHYDIEALLDAKRSDDGKVHLLWAGRFLDLKHPELAIETAAYLKKKGIDFHMNMVGGGPQEAKMRSLIAEYGLEEEITLPGFMKPEQVREYMEKADIFLFNSDHREGWGAVVNEAMNSGCSVVVNHMVGAAPYLIRHGRNGFVYRNGSKEMLFETVERLARDEKLRREIGKEAYNTITETWNAEFAASKLFELVQYLLGQGPCPEPEEKRGFYPCMPAPVIKERKMFGYLTGQKGN